MKKALLAISLLFVLSSCMNASNDAIFDPDKGEHVGNWLVDHRAAYRSDPVTCQNCHGELLLGGISKVSCDNNATGCHGHELGWANPDFHGAAAKAAPQPEGLRGFASCQLCHGDDFRGDTLSSGQGCFASFCHDGTTDPGQPHSPNWRSTQGATRLHSATDESNGPVCGDCHTADPIFNQNPVSGAPGCFNNTLCHGDFSGCDQCHGDQNGKYHPPVAVWGTNVNTANGVGAHVKHVEATGTLLTKEGSSSQVDENWCAECHIVPAAVSDPGHLDTAYPADVLFTNAIESDYNSTTPSFTAVGDPDVGPAGTCSVYCHGVNLPFSSTDGTNTTPSWTDTSTGCNFCHGDPPSTGSHTGLTQGDLTACVACHSATVDSSGAIATPANHIDGTLDVTGTDCWDCHGDGVSKEHPPVAVHGTNPNAASGVGAHVTHIEASATLLSKEGAQSTLARKWCNECHTVPAAVGDSGHVDSNYPGDVSFSSGTESKYNTTTATFTADPGADPDSGTGGTCNVYCHGANLPGGSTNGSNRTPAWGDSFAGACDTCHGAPPNTGSHAGVTTGDLTACVTCHPGTVDSSGNIATVANHINGTVEAQSDCSSCHGDNAAGKDYPPVAVHGTNLNTANGVGAHVHHVENTAILLTKEGTGGTAVAWCNECHTVPSNVGDAGHIDSVYPADVDFAAGTESAYNGTTPVFSAVADPDVSPAGSCTVYCHGANLPSGSTNGQNTTPAWTDSTTGCDFCHGTPPNSSNHGGLTAGDLTQCVACHPDTVNGTGAITTVANHIDGSVQVQADCWLCHGNGTDKSYPPVAVYGTNLNTANGVGAHIEHIENTATLLSKQGSQTALVDKWCNECHVVPTTVGDSGHLGGAYPGDVVFTNGTESKLNTTAPSFTADSGPDTGTGGTCSVYCHGANMPSGDTTGSNRIPAWGDTITGCGACHGAPPSSSAHTGITQLTECVTCHPDTVAANGTIATPANHIDGTLQVQADCTSCHNGVPSGASYVTRDVVGSDFALSSRHVFGGTVSDYDCIVCHREGDATAAASGTISTTSLHNNSGGIVVDMRDVDTPASGWTWDKGNVTNALHTNMDNFCLSCHDSDGAAGIAVVGTGTSVTLTPNSAQSLGPFNDTDGIGTGSVASSGPVNVTGYTAGGSISTDNTHKSRTAVVDAASQFSTSNLSHHAVLGQRYTTTNANWGTSLWVNTTLKNGSALQTTRETSTLHCADCHTVDTNAHGSSTAWMLTASGSGSPNSSPIDATCFQCHPSSVYFNGTGGRWDHSNEQDAWTWKWKGNGGRDDMEGGPSYWGTTATSYTDGQATGNHDLSWCLNCHGGGGGDDPVVQRYGGIHGLNADTSPSRRYNKGSGATFTTASVQRYRFMGGAYLTPNPSLVDGNGDPTTINAWANGAAAEPTCYNSVSTTNSWSTCSKHDTQGDGDKGWNYNFARPLNY